jgi:hypothetical protein
MKHSNAYLVFICNNCFLWHETLLAQMDDACEVAGAIRTIGRSHLEHGLARDVGLLFVWQDDPTDPHAKGLTLFDNGLTTHLSYLATLDVDDADHAINIEHDVGSVIEKLAVEGARTVHLDADWVAIVREVVTGTAEPEPIIDLDELRRLMEN